MTTRKEILEPWVADGHTTAVNFFLPADLPNPAHQELADYHPKPEKRYTVKTLFEDANDPNTSLAIAVGDAWSDRSREVMESVKLIPAAPDSKRSVLIALPSHSDGGGIWWELCHIRLQKISDSLAQKIREKNGFDSIGNELILIWRPKEEKRGSLDEGKIPDEYYYTCWKW